MSEVTRQLLSLDENCENCADSDWISVKENPPMVHTNVLIYIPDHGDCENYAIGYLETDDNFYYNETDEHIDCIDIERVTYWQNLPEPPSE